MEPWGEEDKTDTQFEPPIFATHTGSWLTITGTSSHDQINLATTINCQDKKEGVELLQLQADSIPERVATSGSTATIMDSQYTPQSQQDESCTLQCTASIMNVYPEIATSETFEDGWVSSHNAHSRIQDNVRDEEGSLTGEGAMGL